MIQIQPAPSIQGLTFRHFRGQGDHFIMAAVLTASEIADHNKRMVTAEDIAAALQHMSNCDPYQDMVLAQVAGEVVGYTRGWWTDGPEDSRSYDHNGFVVPQWRRRGIGKAMLTWIEGRLADIAAAHPPELTKFFQASVTQFQEGRAILLEGAGYLPARYYFEMVRPTLEDISVHPLPEGLELRPVESRQYRSIWQAVVETNRDEWGHKELTDEDYQQWLSNPLFQPELWQIAWEVGTQHVVGHVMTYIHHDENKQFNRRRGYTEWIGVVHPWRRQGVARALISQSLLAQKAAGMTESALVADSENSSHATRLHERCGFQVVKRDTLYRKPFVALAGAST